MILSIRKQLLAAFGVLVVALGGLSLYVLANLNTTHGNVVSMYEDGMQPFLLLSSAQGALTEQRMDMLRLMSVTDNAERTKFEKRIVTGEQGMMLTLDSLSQVVTPETVTQIEAFKAAFRDWARVRDERIKLAGAGNVAAALVLGTSQGTPFNTVQQERMNTVYATITGGAAASYASSNVAFRRTLILSSSLLAIAITGALLLGWFVARKITRPLDETVRVLEEVADGNLRSRLTVQSRDELGQMAGSLNTALDSISNALSAFAENAQALASSSEELNAVSLQMGNNATATSSQANVVSVSAEQVNHHVHTVATGTEEMTAAIREIAKNASDAAQVASAAVRVAEETNASVAKLGISSVEIGNVIKVITSIAQQTNLLALNATIEAARAGEAGKGFAVVANEVKELAKETAKATEDISRKIEAIQSDTESAVQAISQIGSIISQINDAQSTIASAVEEQTATTNEMARNVEDASKGSQEIARTISLVAHAAENTTAGAIDTQTASGELARMANELQSIVSRFQFAHSNQTASQNSTATSVRSIGDSQANPITRLRAA
ncbi:MAG: methyl-accepting chemotaxis protein [Gemmatimonadaceae bacterium]